MRAKVVAMVQRVFPPTKCLFPQKNCVHLSLSQCSKGQINRGEKRDTTGETEARQKTKGETPESRRIRCCVGCSEVAWEGRRRISLSIDAIFFGLNIIESHLKTNLEERNEI
uniref:Uncharacterized protein n=1 Tax=Bursaphelenchus xylophilus TaxID=6326 RepID=A0A1I7RQS5_BURXY